MFISALMLGNSTCRSMGIESLLEATFCEKLHFCLGFIDLAIRHLWCAASISRNAKWDDCFSQMLPTGI